MAKQVSDFPKLSSVKECEYDAWEKSLNEFNSHNHEAFVFGRQDISERREFTTRLVEITQEISQDESHVELLKQCLLAMVVMSRDIMSVKGNFVSKTTWESLTLLAGLKKKDTDEMPHGIEVAIASCKCLCNIIFLTKDESGFCDSDDLIDSIGVRLRRLDPESSNENDCDVEFLSLRLLFLISVFNVKARIKIVENCSGRRLLIDYLEKKLKVCKVSDPKTPLERAMIVPIHARSCSEVLKTLFNLNIKAHNEESQVREEKITKEFTDLCSICRRCLLTTVENDVPSTEKLHGDAENSLYSIPSSCLSEPNLLPNVDDAASDDIFSYVGLDTPSYDGRDLSAVLVILKSVEKKIETSKISTENLQPVLSLLSHLSRSSRFVRKYCKNYVLVPRTEFKNRPEVGANFQNKLIKLFTHANTEVKGAAEDFVFVLCKEKVDRLVKYAGYGNSAGLLVNRGLLAGGHGDTIYSDTDTDSDSDTEEYLENANKINPITGHIPPDIPNPMEGMSDEQKEYLAVQLANQLSKLSDDAVIKPVCVDPNTGNLVPFQQRVHETVLPEEKDSDDDSD